MSFENHNTKQIDYDYRKRDLTTKYSYAISRLGTCAAEEKARWRTALENVNEELYRLRQDFNK